MRYVYTYALFILALSTYGQKQVVYTNDEGDGEAYTVTFTPGESFYYPLIAIWLEDSAGNFLQTLYVPNSVANGTFTFGIIKDNTYQPGPKRLPAALPYWGHKRGVKAEDGYYFPTPKMPVPDAYSGASPTGAFVLNTRSDQPTPDGAYILVEVNQSWDWNQYWNNSKYPQNEAYKASAQPALVYRLALDRLNENPVTMELIGHSHHAGANGRLFQDLSTFTTALTIFDKITVERR
ncbi:MAG: hypothetical protein R6U66_05180 [Bacteroidales bacterium]